ncbi:MAG: helix-turn-helix domain-containing protein [Clostridia bacterium]|nr:helix-turn-helix domain-containing protein [Clostridia bacterium]
MILEKTNDFFIERQSWNLKMPTMHYHNTYEVYYLEAGSREYFVEDKVFSIASGSFVLISPYKLHRTGGSYGTRTLIGFSKEFMQKTFSGKALDKILSCFERIIITPSEKNRDIIVNKLNAIYEITDETLIALKLADLLCELADSGDSEANEDERISKIIEYINKNYAEIESIEQIASNFFISKYHLCRMFKNAMSITLIDYLNGIKIKNACAYLKTTDKSVTEISSLTGFNSPAYFTNVFKKITGYTPNHYKKL